jgi:hypothetical protein
MHDYNFNFFMQLFSIQLVITQFPRVSPFLKNIYTSMQNLHKE